MTPNPRRSKKQKTDHIHEEELEVEECENGTSQAIFIPSSFDSGESDSDSDSDYGDKESSADVGEIPDKRYNQILNDYDENQSKLEPNHCYEWVKGEINRGKLPENVLLLSDAQKKSLRGLSAVHSTMYCFNSNEKNNSNN